MTAGTLLHGSGLPLAVWFAAAHFVSQGGVSATRFARLLGLRRYETAWRVLHRVRAALALLSPPIPPDAIAGTQVIHPRGAYAWGTRAGRVEVAGARAGPDLVLDVAHRGDLREAARRGRDRSVSSMIAVLDWYLAVVHHRVSARWLRRYLAEAAVRLARHGPARVLADLTIAARAAWAELNPVRP